MRTLAIALVVAMHGTTAYLEAGGRANLFSKMPFVQGGWIGVDLFFVLSGYFIGRQLWRELQKTGTVSLSRFMIRRSFRIWPLYFIVLAFVILVLGRGGGPSLLGWTDAIFLTNYYNRGVVMGSWSLCTEEQFYIIAPLLLIAFAPRIRSVAGFRKYLVGILVLLPLLRAILWWRLTGGSLRHDHHLFPSLYYPIHSHSDGLVMGLLLSNLEVAGDGSHKKGFFRTGWCVLLAAAACVAFNRAHREILDFSGITLAFGAAVWYLLSNARRRLSLLGWHVYYILSRLSYGMYLNHEYLQAPVTVWLRRQSWHALVPEAAGNFAAVSILFVLSACVSLVTFCAIEYPFLVLRERILAGRDRAARTEGRPAGPSAGWLGDVVGARPGPELERSP